MLSNRPKDGIILEDSEFARDIGFTKDKFSGVLWKREGYVWIGFLQAKQQIQEDTSTLLDRILAKGFGVACPSPSSRLQKLLEEKRFTVTEQPFYIEPFKNGWSNHYCDRKDVWMKEPAMDQAEHSAESV